MAGREIVVNGWGCVILKYLRGGEEGPQRPEFACDLFQALDGGIALEWSPPIAAVTHRCALENIMISWASADRGLDF